MLGSKYLVPSAGRYPHLLQCVYTCIQKGAFAIEISVLSTISDRYSDHWSHMVARLDFELLRVHGSTSIGIGRMSGERGGMGRGGGTGRGGGGAEKTTG